MNRWVRHHPSGQEFDLSALTSVEYQLLASLAGEIKRGDNTLECLAPGGDPWLLVYRHESDVHYARHFPGGAHPEDHRLVRKSDEHLRAQDYAESAYTYAGIPAAQEVRTNNRTRLDVATLDAPVIAGLEVHFTDDSISGVKARTTRSMRATAFTGQHARQLPNGVLPIWLSPNDKRRRWLYTVPTVETSMPWDVVPARNTVTAVASAASSPRDAHPAQGGRHAREPATAYAATSTRWPTWSSESPSMTCSR